MAQHTKQPQVLRELFEALGNDSFVVAECLARPVLAQRLVTELNNEDRVKLTTIAWLKRQFYCRWREWTTQALGTQRRRCNRQLHSFPQYRTLPRLAASMTRGQQSTTSNLALWPIFPHGGLDRRSRK